VPDKAGQGRGKDKTKREKTKELNGETNHLLGNQNVGLRFLPFLGNKTMKVLDSHERSDEEGKRTAGHSKWAKKRV